MSRKCLIAGLFTAALFSVPPADAQQSAPRVRLATLQTTTMGTVAPSISLSEPAYILAVAIDNGGQIEVLSPTLPGDAIRFEAAKSIRFPEFHSGFSSVSNYGVYGSRYRRSAFAGDGDLGTRGSVLVIASRTPFDFAAISDGVDWNEEALRRIMRFKAPAEAVTALGRALTEKGQTFGHDYVYFGRSGYSQFASNSFRSDNNCFMDYSFSPYGYSNFAGYYRVSGASYGGIILAGYGMGGLRLVQFGSDVCGRPHYMLVPVPTLPPPPDTTKVDSVVKPASRSAVVGSYTGEEARRLYETLLRNQSSSDTYVRLARSPVFSEKEDKAMGRPVTREEQAGRVESFEKVRSAADRPINRMPVLREQPARQEKAPVLRAEPVTRAELISRVQPVTYTAPTIQRESKPVEVISPVKDN